MSTYRFSNRSAIRAFVVIALSVAFVAIFASGLRQLWFPLGTLGYGTDGDGTVTDVCSRCPAAGIQIGDRIDLAATPPQFRYIVVQFPIVWQPGQKVTFSLIHRGAKRLVTLTAIRQGFGPRWSVVAEFLAAVLFVVLGAALVLLRPTLMTWGFFFYCLAFSPGYTTVCSAPRT
jgi:hypothetical protein